MGDIGVGEANGVVITPDPSSISKDKLAVAEEATLEVVNSIHPTMDSEEKRRDVIDYVQRLIRFSLGLEVFPYGSVPLKTYLPDGDIDLTVLSSPYAEESWASDVLSVLKREEQNKNAEYEVRDTQFIDAEVKLVKCLVQNIVVDISFNQLGGLCTLCFLEQVDRLIQKDHLFKHSIILIKAWCYYESRILGAHHGLISTYALETLVLYIFHVFHSSLDGPLAVLHRFLDYFSNFDWDNYCISLKGPVYKSSLPEIVVQMPQIEGNELFLSEEFLRNCVELFSVPSRGLETNSRVFLPKHLNIIDPLKEYNNLGRSVHRGNFYRIRSAFKRGACNLGRIFSLPKDEIADEIKKFFGNTLQRHGCNCGSDGQDYVLPLGGDSGTLYSSSPAATLYEDDFLLRPTSDFQNDGVLMEENFTSAQLERYSMNIVTSMKMSEPSYLVCGTPASGYRINGDACDLATHSFLDFMTSKATSECSPSSNNSGPFFTKYHHEPLFYGSKSCAQNGHCSLSEPSDGVEEKLCLDQSLENTQNHVEMVNTFQSCADSLDGICSYSSSVSSPKASILEYLPVDFRERDSDSVVEGEPLNPLANLTGDYDSHLRSLFYGHCCLGFALSANVVHDPPMLPSRIGNKKPWDTVRQSIPLKQSSFSQMNTGPIFIGPPASSHAPSVSAFASKDKHQARGTGTYMPLMNSSSGDKTSQSQDRNKAVGAYGQSQRHTHGNGFIPASSERKSLENGSRQTLHAWCPVQTGKKSGVSCPSHHSKEGFAHANGFSNSLCRIQFGSLGHLVDEVISAPCNACGSSSDDQRNVAPDLPKEEERVGAQSFGIKNEDEFPPLSPVNAIR